MKTLGKPSIGILVAMGLLLLGLSAGSTSLQAADDPAREGIISRAEDRQDIALTVYNADLALVRETRRLDAPAGEFIVEFQDVPTAINTRSLLINVTSGAPLEILEQNYEYDLMSKQKILEKYVGRPLSWIKEDGSRIDGTLLGMADGPIFEVGGEIVFEVPGRIALPDLPENLRARPTLIWQVDSSKKGERLLDVSYLSGGINWSADYVLDVTPDATRGEIQAWVTVDNRSGAGYEDAELMLLAGDINTVRPQQMEMADVSYKIGAARMAPTVEKVHDYHLYTMPRRMTIKDREVKQLSLFSAGNIQVQKRYMLESHPVYYTRSSPGPTKEKVSVIYTLELSRENNLYRALPAGTVRIYGSSASGARQLLGTDAIDHTPRGEKLDLRVGKAFDIVAERKHLDHKQKSDTVYENTYEITLRNHGEHAVTVEVVEAVGMNWEILESSHKAQRLDAGNLLFMVDVPAEKEAKVIYRIQVTR